MINKNTQPAKKAVDALIGKNMHAQRVAALSPAMREWITGILDEEYNRGCEAGRAEMRRGRVEAEWFVFLAGIGAAFAGRALWLWIAH